MTAEKKELGVIFKRKKYFLEDGQIFHIDGRTYVLSNQWGKGTQAGVEAMQQEFGLEIEVEW